MQPPPQTIKEFIQCQNTFPQVSTATRYLHYGESIVFVTHMHVLSDFTSPPLPSPSKKRSNSGDSFAMIEAAQDDDNTDS